MEQCADGLKLGCDLHDEVGQVGRVMNRREVAEALNCNENELEQSESDTIGAELHHRWIERIVSVSNII